jgi:hypothetical protein
MARSQQRTLLYANQSLERVSAQFQSKKSRIREKVSTKTVHRQRVSHSLFHLLNFMKKSHKIEKYPKHLGVFKNIYTLTKTI